MGKGLSAFIVVIAALFVAFMVMGVRLNLAVMAGLGLIVMIVAFVNTDFALFVLIFSMLLSPEFGAGGGVAEGRAIVIRVDDLLLVLIAFTWFAKNALHKELGLVLKTPLNLPIFIYLIACLFPTLLGVLADRVNLLSGVFYIIKYFEYYVVYFMVVNHIQKREDAKKFIIAAIVTALIISLYAISIIPTGERVTAPFEGEGGEPNTLGGYLLLIMSIMAGLLLTLKKRKEKYILAGLIFVALIPFLFSLSRASWLGAIPAYFVFMIYSSKRHYLFVALLLVVIMAPIMAPPAIKERVLYTFKGDPAFRETQKLAGVTFDPSSSERIARYKRSFKRWAKKPILGYGVTGAGFIDGQYNRTLEETGIVGLTAFLLLIYTVWAYAKNTFRNTKDPYLKGLSLGLMAGLVGLMGHGIGSTTFIVLRIMEPFWFFVGMVVVLYQIELQEEEELKKPEHRAVLVNEKIKG